METPPPIPTRGPNKKIRPITSKTRPMTGIPGRMQTQVTDNQLQFKVRPMSSVKMNMKRPISSINPKVSNVKQESNSLNLFSTFSPLSSMKGNRPLSSNKGNMDFRTIRPTSHYQDKCFNKYWESTATEPKAVIPKISTNMNQGESSKAIDRIMSGNRLLYKYPQINWTNKTPASFLTHVGGSEFNISQCDTYVSSRPITAYIGHENSKTGNFNRPFTAMNKRVMTNKNRKIPISAIQRKQRPTTAIPANVQSRFDKENEMNYEYEDSFFNEDEQEQRLKSCPYVADLMNNYNNLNVKTYSIKTAQADTDLLEIFDRSQRTLAATLAKVGDYEYYTSFQRIGSFMDFSMHMKLEDIKNIEKHISQNRNNMLCYQSKHNIQPPDRPISLINASPYFNDPNSMFHGLMPFEEEGQMLISELNKTSNTYDPIDFLPKYSSDDIFNEELYNEDFSKNVVTSIHNYNKYLVSEKIKKSDLKKCNVQTLKKILLSKLNFPYEEVYKEIIDSNMNQIEELYYYTLKTIIMNYILRSPHERKRLNIIFYPRNTLPSSFTIAQHGSFNRVKYSDWVDNYTNAFNYLENNLSLCNIAISGLVDWTRCFNHVDLVYIKNLDSLRDKETNTIHIDEFCRIEEAYMNKAMRFLRDIYYRGSILITKKNKALKRKDMSPLGRWTFKGFIPNTEEYEEENKNISYGMNYEDQLNDFWTNVDLNDLIDIRLTPSNFGFVTYMLRKQIDLSKNDYDSLSAESKIKLNTSATSYCSIFFRKLTEKALNEFCDFFEAFPTNEELVKEVDEDKEKDLNFSKEIEYGEKELKLPEMNAFKITHLVDPIISIKTKYEPLYNLVKLEYNFDQVYEKIVKVIDVLCSLFNTVCTSHFLEFKTILPSDREKIAKEHSSKLNDYFNSAPNQNKSFLEEYYHNLCPNLILDEIETENYMKTYLKIVYPNELFLSDIKSRIYRKIKVQFAEIDECLKIYEPLKEVITNTFDENLKSFLDVYSAIPDYNRYTYFIEKIRLYEKYLSTIPDKIQYSMFAIDTRMTKKELMDKLKNDMSLLMKSLEEEIIRGYDMNIDKFGELIKMIDVKLTTPEELVEMEQKTNAKVASELSVVHRRFEDAYKIYIFLIKIGHLFTDDLINKTVEAMKRTRKYQVDSERVDKMHKENREFLENKFKNEKKEIEDDIDAYLQEVNLLDFQTHINEYDNVMMIIMNLEDKVPKFIERIERNIKDEELLFDYKMEGFEKFNIGKNKLDKLSILWKNIREFYEERKTLIHNFTEDVDIEYYNTIFNEIQTAVVVNKQNLQKEEEIVGKMSKILEDDIDNIVHFLNIIHQVIESPKPLNEDLKKEVLDILDSKSMETSCRDILFNYFSKKT